MATVVGQGVCFDGLKVGVKGSLISRMNLRSIAGLTPETRVRKRSSSLACGRSLRRYSCDVRVARSDPPLQDQNVSIYADYEVSRSWTPVQVRLLEEQGVTQ